MRRPIPVTLIESEQVCYDHSNMWIAFGVVVLVALAIDFLTMRSQGAHKIGLKEAAIWSAAWVALSFVFVGWLWWYLGGTGADAIARELANTKALEFITGYLIEKTLAVDNIFVFLLIFTYFSVPLEYQKRVLMIGILGALVLRAILILAGAWLIGEFHAILYVFGAFLLYTGIQMWRSIGQEPDLESSMALRWVRKRLKFVPTFDGEKFFTMHNGVRVATPLLAVVAVIGIVDVIFAVDSIPAIFAVTTDPFIVLSSNVFAILGLRAMYFLLAEMHERFHLLSYGLSIVLMFIGTKMLLMDIFKVPILVSLGVTFGILAFSMVLSLRIPATKHSKSAYPFPAKEEEPKR
jgi:tellurite resistance protein TerC